MADVPRILSGDVSMIRNLPFSIVVFFLAALVCIVAFITVPVWSFFEAMDRR